MLSRRKFFSAIVAGTGTAILPRRKETPQEMVAVITVDDGMTNQQRQRAAAQFREALQAGYSSHSIPIMPTQKIEYVSVGEMKRRLRNG